MLNGQIGKVTFVKKGNKIHFILICKNEINDRVTKETLHSIINFTSHEILIVQ